MLVVKLNGLNCNKIIIIMFYVSFKNKNNINNSNETSSTDLDRRMISANFKSETVAYFVVVFLKRGILYD